MLLSALGDRTHRLSLEVEDDPTSRGLQDLAQVQITMNAALHACVGDRRELQQDIFDGLHGAMVEVAGDVTQGCDHAVIPALEVGASDGLGRELR